MKIKNVLLSYIPNLFNLLWTPKTDFVCKRITTKFNDFKIWFLKVTEWMNNFFYSVFWKVKWWFKNPKIETLNLNHFWQVRHRSLQSSNWIENRTSTLQLLLGLIVGLLSYCRAQYIFLDFTTLSHAFKSPGSRIRRTTKRTLLRSSKGTIIWDLTSTRSRELQYALHYLTPKINQHSASFNSE